MTSHTFTSASHPGGAMNSADTKTLRGYRQWLCMVGHSGYHNGCNCRPSEPHGGDWGCGWYYVAEPLPAPTPRTTHKAITR